MTAWLILLTMAFMNLLEMTTAVLSATVLTLAVVGTAVYLYVASIRYASIGRNLFLVFTDMDGEETVSDFLKVKRITYVDIADFLKYVKSRRLEMLERKLEAIQV
jgi:phosphoglycerol transferase MdoB-like AlkP superfamily enzyme